MFTRILALIAILTLISSCSTNKKQESAQKAQAEEDFQLEEFETIENEEQAKEIDEKTQEEIEEVEVQDRVYFGYNETTLNNTSKKILNVQADWLNSDPSINITIEGHCDERGTREYNIALGEKRANSVKNYLIEKGVASSRIKIVSYGKERPAFFGATDQSFAKNRRAVTVVN